MGDNQAHEGLIQGTQRQADLARKLTGIGSSVWLQSSSSAYSFRRRMSILRSIIYYLLGLTRLYPRSGESHRSFQRAPSSLGWPPSGRVKFVGKVSCSRPGCGTSGVRGSCNSQKGMPTVYLVLVRAKTRRSLHSKQEVKKRVGLWGRNRRARPSCQIP